MLIHWMKFQLEPIEIWKNLKELIEENQNLK
jgi:hypothetical protein